MYGAPNCGEEVGWKRRMKKRCSHFPCDNHEVRWLPCLMSAQHRRLAGFPHLGWMPIGARRVCHLFRGSAQHVFSHSERCIIKEPSSKAKVSIGSDKHGDEDGFDRVNCCGRRCSRQRLTASIELFPKRLHDREVEYLDKGNPPNN